MNTLVAIVVLMGVFPLAKGQDCPKIITRSEWGAKAPRSTAPLKVFPPPYVIIHHTVTGGCSTITTCSQIMRNMQNQHMNANKWVDIGYNFVVGGDGNVYQGRGWNKVGAHAPNYNDKSIGIAFIGTFTSSNPTATARRAAQKLISCGVAKGQISKSYRLIGHRQVYSTECPGNAFYVTIQKWPHWVRTP